MHTILKDQKLDRPLPQYAATEREREKDNDQRLAETLNPYLVDPWLGVKFQILTNVEFCFCF